MLFKRFDPLPTECIWLHCMTILGLIEPSYLCWSMSCKQKKSSHFWVRTRRRQTNLFLLCYLVLTRQVILLPLIGPCAMFSNYGGTSTIQDTLMHHKGCWTHQGRTGPHFNILSLNWHYNLVFCKPITFRIQSLWQEQLVPCARAHDNFCYRDMHSLIKCNAVRNAIIMNKTFFASTGGGGDRSSNGSERKFTSQMNLFHRIIYFILLQEYRDPT